MSPCKRCGNPFEPTKRPRQRICDACQRARKRATQKTWEAKQDRPSYRSRDLKRKDKQLARLMAWKASHGADYIRKAAAKWRKRNRLSIKLKREMDLPSIHDARRILIENGRKA